MDPSSFDNSPNEDYEDWLDEEMDVDDDDDSEESDRETSAHVANFTGSTFASAEDFAHLLEDSGSKNSTNSHAQVKWEERNYRKKRPYAKRFKAC